MTQSRDEVRLTPGEAALLRDLTWVPPAGHIAPAAADVAGVLRDRLQRGLSGDDTPLSAEQVREAGDTLVQARMRSRSTRVPAAGESPANDAPVVLPGQVASLATKVLGDIAAERDAKPKSKYGRNTYYGAMAVHKALQARRPLPSGTSRMARARRTVSAPTRAWESFWADARTAEMLDKYDHPRVTGASKAARR